MRILKLSVLFMICISTSLAFNESIVDCGDAKDAADEAYRYLKKVYNSDNLDDAYSYAKKGMNSASDAEDKADDEDCDCSDAESAASDTYSYAKKAYNSDNLSDSHYYAKKGMNSASEITSEAEDCED